MDDKRIKIQNKKKAMKRRRIIFTGLVVFILGLIIFSNTSFFDVDEIEIIGNSYFTSEEVINMAHASPGKNIIYNFKGREMKKYLRQNPYIESVKIRRKLPSTISIEIVERKQIGAIQYDDDYLIIDSNGFLLRKTRTEPKLTLINGLTIKKIKLGEKIKLTDSTKYDRLITLLSHMKSSDLYFTMLDMSTMYIKAYIYTNLSAVGTFAELDDAITSGHLHKVLEKLFEENITRGTIRLSDEGYASFEPSV